MSQTQKQELQIVRELQIALMRVLLAVDFVLDVIDVQDDSLKLTNLRLTKKVLEDAKDNIENAISAIELITPELIK